MERSLSWYIGSLRILTNTCTTALTTKQLARKVLFSPCLIEDIPLSQIKMTYTKQVLKENGYQESIISEIFQRITNNHSLSQSQQQMQARDIEEEAIRMSINLPYIEGTSEKLWGMPRSCKVRSTFYNQSTLCKVLCKLKDQAATDYKSNIVKGIVIVVRMKLQNTVGKQITTIAWIRRKLLIGKAD